VAVIIFMPLKYGAPIKLGDTAMLTEDQHPLMKGLP